MKKIMFSDKYGLTDAVLQGRKTMMRRVMKDGTPLGNFGETEKYAKYKIGEVVAVAQSYNDILEHFNDEQWRLDYVRCVEDAYEKLWDDVLGVNNKMFVKSELMLYQIQITDIKVERLQDISDEDCMREGLIKGLTTYGIRFKGGGLLAYLTPREAFADLVDAVSGKGTWESNPWVFAYRFELCK